MSPEQSSNKIGKSVGEKLRAARIAQHYTQSQLAAPDFSVSYISAIERGQIHPSLRALEILAARLGLSSTQLLPARSQQEERATSSANMAERDDEEVELVLLEVHIQIRQARVDRALAQLESLSPKRLKRAQQLQYHYLLGWVYYKLGQLQECDYILNEALQLAKEQEAQYLQGRIMNLQALAQMAMRNYAQALLAHQACLDLLETPEPRDLFFMAQIYMYMGQHYNQLDNGAQALIMFNKALAIMEELSTSQGIHTAYLELCKWYSEKKEYDLATLYAFKSVELTNWETGKRLKSEIYYFLGKALIQEDAEKVQGFLEEAYQKEQPRHDQLTLASLDARYAEWYFRQGRLEEAAQHIRQAYEQTREMGDTLTGADTLILYGNIAYAGKRIEEGDGYFAAGLQMFERLGYHEELVRECVHYAEMLEQAGKDREALTYFKQAYQSQRTIGR